MHPKSAILALLLLAAPLATASRLQSVEAADESWQVWGQWSNNPNDDVLLSEPLASREAANKKLKEILHDYYDKKGLLYDATNKPIKGKVRVVHLTSGGKRDPEPPRDDKDDVGQAGPKPGGKPRNESLDKSPVDSKDNSSKQKPDQTPADSNYNADKEKAYNPPDDDDKKAKTSKPTGRQRVGIYNPIAGSFEYRYYDDDGKLIDDDPPAKGRRPVVPCKDLGDQIDLDHRRLMKMLDEKGNLIRALEEATKNLEEQNARVDKAREAYEEVNRLIENYTDGIDDTYISAVNRRPLLKAAWDRESAKAEELVEISKGKVQTLEEFSKKYEAQGEMQDANYKIWKKIKGIEK